MRHLLAAVAAGLLATAEAKASGHFVSSAGGCTPVQSIGIDTTFAGGVYGGFLGGGVCQTFVAPETLISSITVWRTPIEHALDVPIKLWIVNVDSTGKPLANSVVLDGPVWEETSTDSVHATEVTYTFDPPVVLPSRGMYGVALQDYQCILYFDLETTAQSGGEDRYSQGHLWYVERSNFQGCILRQTMDDLSPLDLIFTIKFCDVAVPTRKVSWGELKMFYR